MSRDGLETRITGLEGGLKPNPRRSKHPAVQALRDEGRLDTAFPHSWSDFALAISELLKRLAMGRPDSAAWAALCERIGEEEGVKGYVEIVEKSIELGGQYFLAVKEELARRETRDRRHAAEGQPCPP